MNKRILKKKARNFTKLCDTHTKISKIVHKNPFLFRAILLKAILKDRIRSNLYKYYNSWVKLRARHMILHGEVYGLPGGGKWLPKGFTMGYGKNSEQMFDLDTMAAIGHSDEEINAIAETMGW